MWLSKRVASAKTLSSFERCADYTSSFAGKKRRHPCSGAPILGAFCERVKRSLSEISDEALGRLSAYDWPGNVRELANAIERAVVLAQGPEIALHDLPARIVAAQPEPRSDGASYRESVDAYRRQLVMRALAQSQGNRAAAARTLGLHEKYLLRLLKSLRIGT